MSAGIQRLSQQLQPCSRRHLVFGLPRTALSTQTSSPSALAAASQDCNSSTPQHTAMRDTITLTDEEKALFDTLLAAAEFSGCKTVLRAAGGWVRDKLLGKESKDIDIALDNMLGKTFAEKVGERGTVTQQLTQAS